MLFFSRPRTRPRLPRFCPSLEVLETRNCLSPTLSLTAKPQDGHTLLLSGQVVADDPSGLTVSFGGGYSGSAVTDATGKFSVAGTAITMSTGAVEAVVADHDFMSAFAMASYTLPSLSLAATALDPVTVFLSGRVTDANPANVTVQFSGAFVGSTVANADGTYALIAHVTNSGTVQATFTDSAGIAADQVAACYTLPVYISLRATPQDEHTVVLSGQVTDASPGGLTVTFTGAYQGSAVTNADGSYSFSATVEDSGTVQATVTDGNGTTSDPASTSYTLLVPLSLSLSVSNVDHRTVTLWGTVVDPNPGGNPGQLTVTFTGACEGSAVTNADGSYCVTVDANALGDIHATVNNSADLGSNDAVATITCQAPTITIQVIHQTSNLYTLSGSVSAAPAEGLIVTISGFADLNGLTATVAADGSFSLTLALNASDCGLVTAQVADWWSVSASAAAYVDAS